MNMATLRTALDRVSDCDPLRRRCGTTPLLEHVDAYARDMAVWLKLRFIRLSAAAQRSADDFDRCGEEVSHASFGVYQLFA